jgi:hypothetical protein
MHSCWSDPIFMMSSNFCAHASGNKNIIQNLLTCNGNSYDLPYYRIYHKNRIYTHVPTRVNMVQWLDEVFMLYL